MNFSMNPKAFLSLLPLGKMVGRDMFLAISANLAGGKTSSEIKVSSVRSRWLKSLLGIKYHHTFYDQAQQKGWVNPVGKGVFTVTNDGIQHLEDLSGLSGPISPPASGGLYIFYEKSTHSFDKFLRGVFANAKSRVWAADSYVDERIFDNTLDSISKTLEIKLIYGNAQGTFSSRAVRFKKQYAKFNHKRYKNLHDRFLVVDNTGYVVGPSIKDAADKSPALVVALGKKDASSIADFFLHLWSGAK